MTNKIKQPRNYHALSAILRSSAGAMRASSKPTNEHDWDEMDWREYSACQGECSRCTCDDLEEERVNKKLE